MEGVTEGVLVLLLEAVPPDPVLDADVVLVPIDP
jgi:hypothetical protein